MRTPRAVCLSGYNEPVPTFVSHSVVHLRLTPDSSAERVSQLLLGAPVLRRETSGDWVRVEGDDTYRGWLPGRFLEERDRLPDARVSAVFAEVRAAPRPDADLVLRLPIGSRVETGTPAGGWTPLCAPGEASGWLPTAALAPPPPPAPERIGAAALAGGRRFLGTPYLWGGSSAFGFDCSGLVQFAYRLAGIVLRRDADIQCSDERFAPVAFEDLLPGDLVFFGAEGRITHVGMHAGGDAFVHAAGSPGVVVTSWTDAYYRGRFVGARRLVLERAGWPVRRQEAENR